MELPSRELMSAVLDIKVAKIVAVQQDMEDGEDRTYGTVVMFDGDRIYHEVINIYELMHMMKEWANKLDKQYELNSYITQQRTGAICEVYEAWHGNTAFGDFEYEGVGVTEFEAVTKACEWILSQKEPK